MPSFRKALLLYNPVSGAGAGLRAVERAAEVFRSAGMEVHLEATRSPGSGGAQARTAVDAGYDAVFACGGDGTVFDVLQGVAGTDATLGIIPLGTGNVLATDLGLPRSAEAAARALLHYESRRVAVGRISYNNGADSRFFTVAAGAGVHAELVYNASAQAKRHGGKAAYFLSGFDLLFRHDFVPFEVEITMDDGSTRRDEVLELVAMRVRSFGGALKRWRPGGSLLKPSMQLVLLRRSSRSAMVRYVMGTLLGTAHRKDGSSRSADVEFLSATRVMCRPRAENGHGMFRQISAQADGEMLGSIPAEFTLVPDGLRLLMPPGPKGYTI